MFEGIAYFAGIKEITGKNGIFRVMRIGNKDFTNFEVMCDENIELPKELKFGDTVKVQITLVSNGFKLTGKVHSVKKVA